MAEPAEQDDAAGAGAVGVGLILVNPKVLLMNAVAGLVIGTAGLGVPGAWLSVAYYTVIAGSTVLLPILAYAVAGQPLIIGSCS